MTVRRLQPHEIIKTKNIMKSCFKKPVNPALESAPIHFDWFFDWYNQLSPIAREQRIKRNMARTKRRKNVNK